MKKKLYWCIQHVDEIGGTEVVSTQLMNELVNRYDIECISTSEITKDIKYTFNKNIKIHSLGMPHEVIRADVYLNEYKNQHKFFKRIGLALRCFYHILIKRRSYKRKVRKIITDKSGILICSSLDSYFFAIKKVKCIFHYHFNSRLYFDFGNHFVLKLCRKPDYNVFLSSTTLKTIEKKEPKIANNSTYIYNPLRFEPILDTKKYNNRIIFVGRFVDQKNPILALQVAKDLKLKGQNFTLDMFGDGGLKLEMENFIQKNNLQDCVHLFSPTNKIKEEMQKSDLLLLTSKYEGFVLVNTEANSVSTPVISSNWGDTVYEIVLEGKNGYIIDSNDPSLYATKICEILNNDDKLVKLKTMSYESSKALSTSKIVGHWYSLLDKLYTKNIN